jgi:hypothetical protein
MLTWSLQANPRNHALIKQAFGSDQILYIKAYFGAPRQAFRNRLKIEPVHMGVGISIKI